MITLSAEIFIYNTAVIQGWIVPNGANNISQSDIPIELPETDFENNPFILGTSKLGEGSKLQSETKFFISAQRSDKDGNFKSPFKIIIKPNITHLLTIKFDTKNNRHPKAIYINGVEYKDDDATFTLKVTTSAEYEVEIRDWNTPNCPLIISSIASYGKLDINRRNCLSIDTRVSERSDYDEPCYGIISNKGQIVFRDDDGEAKDLIKDKLLKKGLRVQTFLHNTTEPIEYRQQVSELYIDTIEYSDEDRTVTLSLTDGLTEWQNIPADAFTIDLRNYTSQKLRWFYDKLVEKSPNKSLYNFVLFDALSEGTQSILENTVIPYPIIDSGNYWRQWTKVCQAGALYLYRNATGGITLNYANGS